MFGVNRWLLLATVLALVASVGIYVWAEYFSTDDISSDEVKTIKLDDQQLNGFITTARLSGEMLYAVVNSAYEGMPPDKKREFIEKVRQAGKDKGYTRVSLHNSQGRSVGYASADRIDIPGQ